MTDRAHEPLDAVRLTRIGSERGTDPRAPARSSSFVWRQSCGGLWNASEQRVQCGSSQGSRLYLHRTCIGQTSQCSWRCRADAVPVAEHAGTAHQRDVVEVHDVETVPRDCAEVGRREERPTAEVGRHGTPSQPAFHRVHRHTRVRRELLPWTLRSKGPIGVHVCTTVTRARAARARPGAGRRGRPHRSDTAERRSSPCGWTAGAQPRVPGRALRSSTSACSRSADVSHENPATAARHARQASGRGSASASTSRATSAVRASEARKKRAASPSVSRWAGRSQRATGAPQAAASTAGRPKPSASDGLTTTWHDGREPRGLVRDKAGQHDPVSEPERRDLRAERACDRDVRVVSSAPATTSRGGASSIA